MFDKKHLILLLLFCYALQMHAQVTFVIKSLPQATPNTDTIFITGSFNNWQVNDPECMLTKQLDGTFTVTLPIDSITEYKFTRGSWMKVETDAHNSYTSNRIYSGKGNETVYLEIINWLDLGGVKSFNYWIFYYFAMAILGFILVFSGYRPNRPVSGKYFAFALFNVIGLSVFFGVVVFNLANSVLQAYLTFLVKASLFLWGPCLYLYVNSFLKRTPSGSLYIHFIPAFLIVTLGITSMINPEAFSALNSYVWFPLSYEDAIVVGLGVVSVFIYFIRLYYFTISIERTKKTFEVKFIKQLIVLNTTVLLSFFVNLLLLHFSLFVKSAINYDLVFVVFSGVLFQEALFMWKHPEIFNEKSHQFQLEFPPELRDKICRFMHEEKPFKNPDLNIDLFAELLNTKPHVLSKVLNECFNKNFRDFVNGYRIEEFIQLAEKGYLENYTFLALAHEVGFNSKSTFNLAFKKITRQNPRTYFKFHRIASEFSQ